MPHRLDMHWDDEPCLHRRPVGLRRHGTALAAPWTSQTVSDFCSVKPKRGPVPAIQRPRSVFRFMGREHLRKLDVNRGHEPMTDRSADSHVREWERSGSRGHSCQRSGGRFMGSLHDLQIAHGDHEFRKDELHESPTRMGCSCQSGPRVTRPSEAGRFMESLHDLEIADWHHEPRETTGNVSTEFWKTPRLGLPSFPVSSQTLCSIPRFMKNI